MDSDSEDAACFTAKQGLLNLHNEAQTAWKRMNKLSRFLKSSPFRVVAIYATVSFLWIYFSDTLLNALVHDPQIVTRISVFKGFLFVLVTTILLYFLIRRDVLKMLQRDNALRESETRLRRFYESGMVGAAYWNTRGAITDANNKFLEMIGYTREELTAGKIEWNKLTPPEYRLVDEECVKELRTMGVNQNPSEKEYIRKDGTRIPIAFACAMLDEENGIGIILDITDRKKTEEALAALAVAKSKFASTISHELRSPLAAIKEATNLVLDGSMGPVNDGQKDVLGTAKDNIDRLGRLINNVLVYQKMETGKFSLVLNEDDINDVVREVHKNAMLLAGGRSADLVIELGADLPKIKFDKDRIFQVLTNLSTNAMKYSESGAIVIQTQLGNGGIHISVRDSGPGIKTEYLEKIFEPFSQVGDHHKEGTGLGLAISKEIVLAHHGRIWAESEARKGSAFHFILPFEEIGSK